MAITSRNRILRALLSGFVVNGSLALIGFLKMGIVANAISSDLLPSYFIYLAIWSWFATNGESVRQASRQTNSSFTWRSGIDAYKQEWKILLPFSIIILLLFLFTEFFDFTFEIRDVLITLFFGWLFVYTSTYTGILESTGRIELANWTTLAMSMFTLTPFLLVSKSGSLSMLLFAYFFMNIMPGIVHGLLIAKKSNYIKTEGQRFIIDDLFRYKRIVLLESLPRVAVPFFLTHNLDTEELSIYSILIRLFIIYSVYAISINPVISLENKHFASHEVRNLLKLIGPIVFVSSSIFIFLFSERLISLLGATNVQINFLELIPFFTLGIISISTQQFIGSCSNGARLLLREKSIRFTIILSIMVIPFSTRFLGFSGGFISLGLCQLFYFFSLKRFVLKSQIS